MPYLLWGILLVDFSTLHISPSPGPPPWRPLYEADLVARLAHLQDATARELGLKS
jgi:hypothetical protein